MESESYSALLGELADALKRWTDDLFNEDARCHFGFPLFVEDPLVLVLVKLGAERRGFLAELIDADMKGVLKRVTTFVAAVMREPVPDGRKSWEGATLDTIFSNYVPTAVAVLDAAIELRVALSKCDWLFCCIDQEIQQTDSPGREEGTGYILRFDSDGFSPKELYGALKISDKSLHKYADEAGVVTPGRGEGRSHRYSLADAATICRYVIANVTDEVPVENAKQLLLKIETKSKTES